MVSPDFRNDNGNLIQKDEATDTNLFYNWDNKLRFAQCGASTITFKYDPQGNRIVRNSNQSASGNRRYIIDVSSELPTILVEIDPCTSSLKRTYVYANSEILAQHNGPAANAEPNFYMHDRLGSTRQVINKAGSVVRYYSFDPFGKKLEYGPPFSAAAYPFMFTGQYFDYEIGQYYLRARQYDPILMRFTSRDALEEGKFEEPFSLHKYLYCFNDPINNYDPTGKMLDPIIAESEGAEMYAQDLAIGGLALTFTYAMLMQNEFYQMGLESIAIGLSGEIDEFIKFGADVLASTQAKMSEKHIAGAIRVINDHFNRIANYSGDPKDPRFRSMFDHIRRHVNRIKKLADRLKGKKQEEALNEANEFMKQLEEAAKKHGLPWNN